MFLPDRQENMIIYEGERAVVSVFADEFAFEILFFIRSNLLKITVWGRPEACCRCESPELRAPAAGLLLSD